MDSLNRLFDVLSTERRRYALYVLDEADGPVAIEELAERIRELDDDAATERFDDLVLSLEHTHLPKAAQAEYVAYDRATNEIEISGEPTEFRILLRVSEAMENPDDDRVFDPDNLTPNEFLSRLRPASD